MLACWCATFYQLLVWGGWCTGLPGRPFGRHKMADYLLSAADVKWLVMEMSQCLNELDCQVDVIMWP